MSPVLPPEVQLKTVSKLVLNQINKTRVRADERNPVPYIID